MAKYNIQFKSHDYSNQSMNPIQINNNKVEACKSGHLGVSENVPRCPSCKSTIFYDICYVY